MSQLLEIHRDPQKILYIEIYPSELLICPYGRILAKDLRGEELGKTLSALLK